MHRPELPPLPPALDEQRAGLQAHVSRAIDVAVSAAWATATDLAEQRTKQEREQARATIARAEAELADAAAALEAADAQVDDLAAELDRLRAELAALAMEPGLLAEGSGSGEPKVAAGAVDANGLPIVPDRLALGRSERDAYDEGHNLNRETPSRRFQPGQRQHGVLPYWHAGRRDALAQRAAQAQAGAPEQPPA